MIRLTKLKADWMEHNVVRERIIKAQNEKAKETTVKAS